MFRQIYEWIQNIAVYLILVMAVMQAIPGKDYKKYIQFFSGLVLILLLMSPILKLTGMETKFYDLYHSREYEQEKQMLREQEKYLEEIDLLDFLPDEYQNAGVLSEESDGSENSAENNSENSSENSSVNNSENSSGNSSENSAGTSRSSKIEVEGIRIGE